MVDVAALIIKKTGQVIFATIVVTLTIIANAETIPEYAIKAAFLYNFIDYVTWPNGYSENNEIKSICVIGSNPFAGNLQGLAKAGTNINPVNIEFKKELNELNGCHILFISRSEQNRLLTIINFLKDQPVLTVSDIHEFVHKNGMIELAVRSNKVKILLNLGAVKNNHITINSNLIELATVVNGSKDQGSDE